MNHSNGEENSATTGSGHNEQATQHTTSTDQSALVERPLQTFHGVAYSTTEGLIVSSLPSLSTSNVFNMLDDDVLREEAETGGFRGLRNVIPTKDELFILEC